jgi:putative DNA primase/helicase
MSLLGLVREHLFTIATGTGANGKSTACSALLNAVGDYGHTAESNLFMAAKANPNSATPAKMGLRGRRLVVVSETERDHQLATALMKDLTGGSAITARPLYGKPVTFPPSHTVLLQTNHLPKVEGDDPAAWRRIRVVPFDIVIPKAEWDLRLGERLELEADGILGWIIDGYRQYQQTGMAEPGAVQIATADYLKESDAVARFIDDCCLPGGYVRSSDLWRAWEKWCPDNGEQPGTNRRFKAALQTRGYPWREARIGNVFDGLSLAAKDDQ